MNDSNTGCARLTTLSDLHVSVAALTTHALNIGFGPVITDVPALTRDRLSRVDQHYLGSDSCAAANAVLIAAPAPATWRRRRAVGWSPPSTGCSSS